VVARTNAVVGLSILLALLAGTLVGSLPGLPDWAPVAAVLTVGVIVPQLVNGYLDSTAEGRGAGPEGE